MTVEKDSVKFNKIAAKHPKATIKIRDNTSVNSFGNTTEFTLKNLKPGINIMEIEVTSEDKTVTNIYKVRVNFKLPAKASLLKDLRVYTGEKDDRDRKSVV